MLYITSPKHSIPGNRFPRIARIVKTDDFSSVFTFRKRISGHFLAIHYRPVELASARLGLVIGKKTAKRSVDRNYMRRVLRELFRHHRPFLKNLDIVVRSQRAFNARDYEQVRQEFETLTVRLRLPAVVVSGAA